MCEPLIIAGRNRNHCTPHVIMYVVSVTVNLSFQYISKEAVTSRICSSIHFYTATP